MTNSRATKQQTIVVVKAADETVNNSVTYQNDDELLVALKISKTYIFELRLRHNSGTTPDLKIQFIIPSGAVLSAGVTWSGTTAGNDIAASATQVVQTSGSNGWVMYNGTVIMSTTAGNLQLQWAQNTQTVADTKILQGSSLIVWEQTT